MAVGVADKTQADERIDASGCLVIPGNVNAHMHLYSALARGMPYRLAPPGDFVQILQRVWWRLDRALDEESVRASALVGGLEALLAGTTTLIDHHASPNAIDGSLDVVAEALASLGLRSVCCYEVTDRDGLERARAGLAENERFIRRTAAGELPLARGMVGAHASFTLSDETLAACAGLAADTGVGLHIHAAEDAADEADAERRHGARVARRLADAGALDARTLLAHGVHLDEEEARLVRDAGATLAHNPRSNMNNAVGRTPLAWLGRPGGTRHRRHRQRHVRRVAGGLLPLARRRRVPRPGLAAGAPGDGAGVAARAFGEPALGRIEPGAPADLVILDYDAPTPLTADSLAGHWLYGLGARWVRDVIVAGSVVVRDRRLPRTRPGRARRRGPGPGRPALGAPRRHRRPSLRPGRSLSGVRPLPPARRWSSSPTGSSTSSRATTRSSASPAPRFFVPRESDRFRSTLYGQPLETPFGVAAGPHTQMAQNIIVAWAVGARFIELKTVQTLDELEVHKPCIDMQDEGYNVEWSQELRVHESFEEYLRAWVLIHALHHRLGFPGPRPGVIFNMSVGYDLAGIQQPNVQWYLDCDGRRLGAPRGAPRDRRASLSGRAGHRHPGPHLRQRDALDHARLPAGRDRPHLGVPAHGARAAHVGEVQPHAPGCGARAAASSTTSWATAT